jgi:AraC family transcriptional regulator
LRNAPPNPDAARADYVQRVNRVIDAIVRDPTQPLQLDDVAELAGFSPFHFHRIFRSLLGETLHQFVTRLRLERAIQLMSHTPQRTLTQVALDAGFDSSSDFSRVFKKRFGMPPSAFDIHVYRKEQRQQWEATVADAEHRHLLKGLPPGENPDGFTVQLRELPARTVAYIRVHNSYRPGVVPAAIQRLLTWAEARGLADGQWLGYQWEDPEIVPAEQCRYDVAVEVPDVEPEGEVGRFDFPPMLVAQVEIRGAIDLEMRAIDWLYRTWLPTSGYVPANLPAFEAWLGRPFAHGMEHFELLMQIPVER